ncbi:MAG TPA: fluoride efflux transporter CrcB [Acidocella sp.]|jgi:CrcB protein|uniref:fluoride efflux transporter CrcB n=1 Tax=Acidocella sp. TaxID=50710 RepID=UPI002D170BB7|nr:fluoride efflux transporter CrcB [Acidocella sp.]HVE23345.1 fluoride efflux transporter CrcB [Acidocella sp.]
MLYLWVAIGGAIGSVARFWFGNAMAATLGAAFPWGTLTINVLGSFLISFFSGLTGMGHRFALPSDARIFFTVGVCGGFTTFSSFSLQTVELARGGQTGRAALYVAASLIICLAACAFGVWAASAINQQAVSRA